MGNTPTPTGSKKTAATAAFGSNTVSGVSGVGAQLADQAKTDLLTPVNATLDSIIATPSAQNVVGQGALLLASLVPLLPVLEGQGIKDIAVALKSALNAPSSGSGQSSGSGSGSGSGSTS